MKPGYFCPARALSAPKAEHFQGTFFAFSFNVNTSIGHVFYNAKYTSLLCLGAGVIPESNALNSPLYPYLNSFFHDK